MAGNIIERPSNTPQLFAIDRKMAASDGLFFVWEAEGVRGTIMAGYDGHRGWLYSLAVAEDWQNRGIGSALVKHAETALRECGCVKINLQILAGNDGVVEFYRKLGFVTEERISMGRHLAPKPTETRQ